MRWRTFAWPLHPEADHTWNAGNEPNFRGGTPLGDYDAVERWNKEWAEMGEETDGHNDSHSGGGYNDGGWR